MKRLAIIVSEDADVIAGSRIESGSARAGRADADTAVRRRRPCLGLQRRRRSAGL
jgi:hypothetical protein